MSFEDDVRDVLHRRAGTPNPGFEKRIFASLSADYPDAAGTRRWGLVAAAVLAVAVVSSLIVFRPTSGHLPVGIPAKSPLSNSPTPAPSSGPTPSPGIYYPTTVVLSPAGGQAVWAAVWGFPGGQYLFLSQDGGGTWAERSLPPDAAVFISFIDAGTGWALFPGSPATQCQAQFPWLWRTSDGARTWTRLAPMGIGDAGCKNNLVFADSSHGFLDDSSPNSPPLIYRTVDGGMHWTASAPLPDPPGQSSADAGFELTAGPVFSSGGELLVSAHLHATDGSEHTYVYRSLDGGATWRWASNAPQGVWQMAFLDASHWWGLGQMPPDPYTSDAGAHWGPAPGSAGTADGAGFPLLQFVNLNVGYKVDGRGSIERTADGGRTWTGLPSPGLP